LKTLVLGLGNPILSDDGVGLRVVHELEGLFDEKEVTVMESTLAGLSLLDFVAGYQRVIIVDSIQRRGGKVGEVYRLGIDDISTGRHAASVHDVDLATALELGRRLGLDMPQEVVILAVQVQDVTTFSESLTPEVERVVPQVVEMVKMEIEAGSRSRQDAS